MLDSAGKRVAEQGQLQLMSFTTRTSMTECRSYCSATISTITPASVSW